MGCAASLLFEISAQQVGHKTGEGLALHHRDELGLLVQGIGDFDRKTLHGKAPG